MCCTCVPNLHLGRATMPRAANTNQSPLSLLLVSLAHCLALSVTLLQHISFVLFAPSLLASHRTTKKEERTLCCCCCCCCSSPAVTRQHGLVLFAARRLLYPPHAGVTNPTPASRQTIDGCGGDTRVLIGLAWPGLRCPASNNILACCFFLFLCSFLSLSFCCCYIFGDIRYSISPISTILECLSSFDIKRTPRYVHDSYCQEHTTQHNTIHQPTYLSTNQVAG
ncbi:hypothetical protein BD289DRAFT_69074 [Coniella lustricola]|uniref:Uncharacterized protein n=1 Tax=Coniella lustricola TaxID=2025994 RepID=A0A2T2ZZZ9_9PEZI|nr:hypothetical protein BD289DRAFT_69074 [Coniella lustricola]